ncbi:MAG TPA: type II secretion system F family protein [Hyphomicrobiaceae bacterium]|nr:type II secretion system F family protein [Hyphomicrobiaceae bacterium]
MLSPEMIQYSAVALAALAVAGIAYALAFPYISGEKQTEKRVKSVTENRARRTARKAQVEQTTQRKQAVADTLKEIEERQKKKAKVSLRVRLLRAGLEISTKTFWILSAGCGVLAAAALIVAMPSLPPIAFAATGFIGAFGLPRWILGFLIKRRQNKFIDQFADAIDVIVRGVKTGLPLNECLGIIARESAQPIRGEFQELVDQQRVGVTLAEGFDRMMLRMPLAEVRFFAIVIAIQQQAGGNLSEALGNLSGVLRARKQMAAKVQALSAEAKASAAVLGSLPPGVMIMVYLSTPSYIMVLFNNKIGQFMIVVAACWMLCGILVMKKMINFKF